MRAVIGRKGRDVRSRVFAVVVVSLVLAGLPRAAGAQDAAAAQQTPRLTLAFEARVQVGPPMEVGDVAHGRRRIVPILGGTFEGPGIKGTVRSGGADWQIIRPDGFSELDTRYTLETDKGQIIYVQNAGIRHASPELMKRLLAGELVDPSLVYFRTVATFETAAPELQWLTKAIFVGTGQRYPSDVRVQFWKLE